MQAVDDSRVVEPDPLHSFHVYHEKVVEAASVAKAAVDKDALIELGDGETGSRRWW